MLGMYFVLDNNNMDQVKHTHKKETALATSIRAGGVQQNKSWKALTPPPPRQIMKYPLSAMTLNEEEYKKTMLPTIKFGLTKSGISSTSIKRSDMGPVPWEASDFLTP